MCTLCRFHSIGLRKYGINSLRSLLISLIPPTIFIAVMAMQLRYFSPKMSGIGSANLPLHFNNSALHSSSSPADRTSAMMVNVPLESQEEEEGIEGMYNLNIYIVSILHLKLLIQLRSFEFGEVCGLNYHALLLHAYVEMLDLELCVIQPSWLISSSVGRASD